MAIVGILIVGGGITGCTTNPATGKKVITFNSMADEKRIGKQEHPRIIKQFGGIYKNNKINSYIKKIGNKLVKVSELPHIGWTFTVLNSKEVNAFALPGGFVYVTRGLIALASSEAELAGVIAHEIGHVTALHSSSRQATGRLVGLGALAAGALFGSGVSEIGNLIGNVSIQQYSQNQEFEADSLGIRYLRKVGYDSHGMAKFLKKLRASSHLNNKINGRPKFYQDEFSIFSSHPQTKDRVNRVQILSSQTPMQNRAIYYSGRTEYLEKLHGVIFGDDEKQGYIRGQTFIHPEFRFQFSVPKGFRLLNTPTAVIAKNTDHSTFRFDMDFQSYHGNLATYMRQKWLSKYNVINIRNIKLNGLPGAIGSASVFQLNKRFNLNFLVAQPSKKKIFRMMFITAPDKTKKHLPEIRETFNSLKTITPEIASNIRPLRILIKAVGVGDNISLFANKMLVNEFKEETFRVLNGLLPKQKLRTGQLVKIVGM